MKITDPTWLECFGTDTDRIEKPKKVKPGPIPRHQFEAGLIIDKPWLFGFGEQPAQATETPSTTTSNGTASATVLTTQKRERTLFENT